ncbi:MAG: esterase family protein [Geodermatophilaceae bacterium]|nr:esterase family protein [Geodermatophilaceae bacterium]
MALLRVDFFSDVLELSTSMTVLLPQPTSTQIGMSGATSSGPPPVLYLLHGLSDDDSIWTRRTSIERYVAPMGLAVVMPQVNRSCYADEVHGNRYWTFLSEELPALVARFFRVSAAREDTFVAGLSMGGYGAMKWALREPGRFAAAASLSGALDVGPRAREGTWRPDLIDQVYGDRPIAGGPDDLLWLLGRADVATLPELFVCCGTEDDLIDQNHRFVDAATELGVEVAGGFGPGEHEWGYWDRTIQDVLAWLPLRTGSVGGEA